MKNKMVFVFALLNLIFVVASYASYPQKVTACLTVMNDTTEREFTMSFVSTDFFDTRKYIHLSTYGKNCITHVYSSGPKSISLTVGISDPNSNKNIFIRPDSSCNEYFNQLPIWVVTKPLETFTRSVTWYVTLTQSKLADNPIIFNMSCERINSN